MFLPRILNTDISPLPRAPPCIFGHIRGTVGFVALYQAGKKSVNLDNLSEQILVSDFLGSQTGGGLLCFVLPGQNSQDTGTKQHLQKSHLT